MPSNPNFAMQRRIMVDRQIRTFDVTDRAVIARMLEVPRELFLPDNLAPFAYSDAQLQVAGSRDVRKLVAPFVLARLIQWGALTPSDKVLVVADGLGYAAAVIAGLSRSVVALESDPDFTERTRAACTRLGLNNVSAITGALAAGYPPASPYDVVFVLGVVEAEPNELCAQLSNRGRLMTFQKPASDSGGRAAKAVRITRVENSYSARPLFDGPASVLDAFRSKPAFVF